MLLLFFSRPAKAQNQVPADSTNLAFLPALAYNSDIGLVAGGILNYFHYREDAAPFYSYTALSALVSTKGLASVSLTYDKTYFLSTTLRLTGDIYLSRLLEDPYFGIGNYTAIPGSMHPEDDFYSFKSLSAGFEFTFRHPLHHLSGGRQLDLTGILTFSYNTPWDTPDTRLIAVEKPTGYDGGRTSGIGTGIIWESRNNEFRPANGRYAEISAVAAQSWLGSSFNNFILKTELRNYLTFHVIRDVTLANRLYIKHTSGQVPYWELAYAGDKETLRGYPLRRFMDDNAAVLNTELRTWLFGFDIMKSEFGGTLFFDTGRSFSNSEPVKNIFKDLKYTFGFGGTASFFTPDFILRADVGFSKEGTGIYFTTGYMF